MFLCGSHLLGYCNVVNSARNRSLPPKCGGDFVESVVCHLFRCLILFFSVLKTVFKNQRAMRKLQ